MLCVCDCIIECYMCVLEDVCMKLWHVQGALKLQLASETERAEAAEKTVNMQSAAIAEVMHVLSVCICMCVCEYAIVCFVCVWVSKTCRNFDIYSVTPLSNNVVHSCRSGGAQTSGKQKPRGWKMT